MRAAASRRTAPPDLLGTWSLTRSIEDRASGERLHVTGSTELSLQEDGRVAWSETGTMVRGDGSRIPVSRELLVEERAEGWMVLFADGREFHPWAPGTQVVHPCGSDLYDGLIDVPGNGSWHVTWHVRGPQKDLSIRSTLS